ncbi:MAG: citrate synthase [Candidatus Omnitrophica bacterium]|jgi:citrate synthase|nr:citrate synthase [Candidatus Omnitrophota bacterium]
MSSSKIIGDAELRLPDNQVIKLPVHEGSEGERGIDITNLRAASGAITLDPGYANSGSCLSSITYIDGDKGILRYRGIPIEELAEKSTFLEVSYLLTYGNLPTQKELTEFSNQITHHSMIHEDMKRFFTGYPVTAHPMSILSSMICSLSSYYPDSLEPGLKHADMNIIRILSKVSTIAAFSHKKSMGQPFIGPLNRLSYVENFLNMMFAVPAEPYQLDADVVRALEMILVLHADHEQNCSTSTVRMVGSSQANLYASISSGICALWGPLHGGANQAVIEMLTQLHTEGTDIKSFVTQVKDKKAGSRLMGFGHRVYKNFDPRAKILKNACDKILTKMGIQDPLLDLAKELEATALQDPYFIERKLYPNVDFYSGIILRAIGIPINMFTVMFAIGRMPGWIANWREMLMAPGLKIARPRQIYTGPTINSYIPIEKRA